MKLLFLTIVKINSISERGIYTDLLRKFRDEGHEVFVVTPIERREKKNTFIINDDGVTILNVKTFNLQKINIIEKGLGTLAIEYQYKYNIKKYFNAVKFDVILYSTPPITFHKSIAYIKKRDNALSYLLLKDIFPQNAVDMGMIKENTPIYYFFRRKEEQLYKVSDFIGCMSERNKSYILKHNKFIDSSKVEVNPNSISPIKFVFSEENKRQIKRQYKIPDNCTIFVYGGNLGKPQGINFLLETIEATKEKNNSFFIVIGSGTEYKMIKNWFILNKPQNAKLLESLPKADYDKLLSACDVGLIFLNKNFTIPNFPSRLLSYLENKMPVIAATDQATDIGEVIEKAGCGYWVHSGDIEAMKENIDRLCSQKDIIEKMKEKSWNLLISKFDVANSYQLILEKCRIR